jgi:hypothetical protein
MLGQISGVESQKTEPHPLLLHPAPILEIQRTEKLANQSPKMSRATRITNNKAPPKSPIPGKKRWQGKEIPKALNSNGGNDDRQEEELCTLKKSVELEGYGHDPSSSSSPNCFQSQRLRYEL